jgi:hypothetical protein
MDLQGIWHGLTALLGVQLAAVVSEVVASGCYLIGTQVLSVSCIVFLHAGRRHNLSSLNASRDGTPLGKSGGTGHARIPAMICPATDGAYIYSPVCMPC